MSDRIAVPIPRASRPSVGLRARTAAVVPSDGARAEAKTISLDDSDITLACIIDALPNPSELAPGTLVIVPGANAARRSLARTVLAVFGRSKTIPRPLRCSALLARGYVDIGAAEDEAGADLAWGRAPAPATRDPGA